MTVTGELQRPRKLEGATPVARYKKEKKTPTWAKSITPKRSQGIRPRCIFPVLSSRVDGTMQDDFQLASNLTQNNHCPFVHPLAYIKIQSDNY